MKKLWRKIHRWLGLLLTAFTLFYCLTGLLLNHRQSFSYFQTKEKTVSRIEVQDQAVLQGFVEQYKGQINRKDDPKVIRIKDNGMLEFLYGSHGRTTYVIDPQQGTMTKIDKLDRQPWHWLNRLHKSYKTSTSWILLTDGIALFLVVLTLSGLIIFRYKRQDAVLLLAGFLLLLLGLAVG